MKNLKFQKNHKSIEQERGFFYDINKEDGGARKSFEDPSSEEMAEEVIGTKELYNWLYQQEEEEYYLSVNVSDSLPNFSEVEALFVEY